MGIITDLIKGLPISAVLDEKLKALEKRYENLEKENLQLKEKNNKLKEKIAEIEHSAEFEDYEGLLWKKIN